MTKNIFGLMALFAFNLMQLQGSELWGKEKVEIDFRQPGEIARWIPVHHVKQLQKVSEGMEISISGDDPYIHGPALKLNARGPWLMKIRVRSETSGLAQIFYFDRDTTEEKSVRFPVNKGAIQEVIIPLPSLPEPVRLRFDPPGTSGKFLLQKISLEPRTVFEQPTWPAPKKISFENSHAIASLQSKKTNSLNPIRIEHHRQQFAAFQVLLGNQVIATSHHNLPFAYLADEGIQWFEADQENAVIRKSGDSLIAEANYSDRHGGIWRIEQIFRPEVNRFEVSTTLSVSKSKEILFAPLLVLLPGNQTYGAAKQQAIFPGLEYLENEPSSSTADLKGPASVRRVPLAHKITIPLMAIKDQNTWLSLQWQRSDQVAALFDSPDRIFHSQAHTMALIAPGASGQFRIDGEVMPFRPYHLEPEQSITVTASIAAGYSECITAAVENWIDINGVPPLPPQPSLDEYSSLTAAAWLDTPIRNELNFQHAIGPNFSAHPALDAAVMMEWLAKTKSIKDPNQENRLLNVSQKAAELIPAPSSYHSHIGHLKWPTAALYPNRIHAALQATRDHADRLLDPFNTTNIATYHPPANGIDYSITHYSKDSNGIAAQRIIQSLRAAMFAGDPAQITKAIEAVRWLDRWDHTVPRGAQTWEIPLHTPDILASAHLTHAYALAFALTREPAMLQRAKQWALTGIPFIYLSPPTGQPIGLYSTIAVFGATQWIAPVWIGLPVQWCGLVYADALRELQKHDPSGPWKTIADGIVLSAIQQLYPSDHLYHGLLPDSFELTAQVRNPSDINPASLQPLALPLLGALPSYQCEVLPATGIIAHFPGSIAILRDNSNSITLETRSNLPASLLLNRCRKPSTILIDGEEPPAASIQINEERQNVILLLPTKETGHRIDLKW
jgi:hypothetical protein